MEALNANEAKTHFGEMLLKAQRAPVQINKNGKPVAVVVSIKEYEQLESLKEYKLKMLLKEGINALQAGKVSNGNEVIVRLRKQI